MNGLDQLRALLREPLVHFLALGALFFLVGRGTGDESGPMGSRIVVTEGEVARLASSFAMTWQRPPSQEELQGLIDDHIREEVYYRESLALGLDRDDIIIRRRLRQKMEFLSQDLADAVTPTDEELQAYLDANPDAYHIEPRYSFSQRYFGTDDGLTEARLSAEAALAATRDRSNPEAAPPGDRSMLAPDMEQAPSREIARNFGERFVTQLPGLPVGAWTGPIDSGYGYHLVYIRERSDGRAPALDEVRPLVVRDWTSQHRSEVNDEMYERLLDDYTVVLERPEGNIVLEPDRSMDDGADGVGR